MTLHDQLIDKVTDEYNEFLRKLKTQPPNQIIESSYEKVFKADLALTVENMEFSDAEITAMLPQEDLLGALYQDWLDVDASYMDMLAGCVDKSVEVLVNDTRREQAENEPPRKENPKARNSPREPSLLGELRETALEIEARKADRPANPAKKQDKELE